MDNIFENIWNDYHNKLRFFISQKINDKDIAEDILQDVFIRIYEKIETLDSSEKINGWIYSIAKNRIIDFYRFKKEHDELPDNIVLEDENENELEKKVASWLMPFISSLTPTYSHILYLSEVEGLTLKEIAEVENLSYAAVKSRIQRGRKELKKLLFDCCSFEFDSRGGLLEYKKNRCKC